MACEDVEKAKAEGRNTSVPVYEENQLSSVKHVIGVVSGKGGVGKSMVTGILATELSRQGYKVGILDADITGPSIPRMFGKGGEHIQTLGKMFLPSITKTGIKLISANLLLAHEDDPVLWRGPVLAGAIQQFWSQTSWGEIDYLLVDMPPGTGDVALTVFQSLPVDGVVIVSSPQDLVQMVVGKAVNMASKMDIPVLGLVENMAYVQCPDCGKKIEMYGPSHLEQTAEFYDIAALGQLPIDPRLAMACDKGSLEFDLPEGLIPNAAEKISNITCKHQRKQTCSGCCSSCSHAE